MDPAEKAGYEQESQAIRAELKKWEGQWATDHGGSKPGREDIKQNPEIAQKYKTYNKMRDILAGKLSAPPEKDKAKAKPRKRKSTEAAAQTPSKRLRPAQTPSQSQKRGIHVQDAATPSTARKLFSPAVPTSIGPTPQRDGRVLGIFDLLEATPSRSTREAGVDAAANIQATPRRGAEAESAIRLGRTPVSSAKRHMLDSFMTPLRKRDPNVQGGKTPTTVSKLQFATPAFLKRAPLPQVDENGELADAAPIRLPRKPLVRGLSSVVASLRKMEQDKLDDDLEALREMENDAGPPPTKAAQPPAKQDALVEDSQVPRLPLGGFDDEGMYDSPPEEALGRDGQPLRVFKKKGQKRTTRRSNMRPTRKKRPTAPTEDEREDAESGDEEGDVVRETQLEASTPADGEPDGVLSGSEFAGSGDEEEAEVPKKRSKAKKQAAAAEPKIKKAVRKVNELAHANFRRLKLRGNGAKGGPGYGSRFRRRR